MKQDPEEPCQNDARGRNQTESVSILHTSGFMLDKWDNMARFLALRTDLLDTELRKCDLDRTIVVAPLVIAHVLETFQIIDLIPGHLDQVMDHVTLSERIELSGTLSDQVPAGLYRMKDPPVLPFDILTPITDECRILPASQSIFGVPEISKGKPEEEEDLPHAHPVLRRADDE